MPIELKIINDKYRNPHFVGTPNRPTIADKSVSLELNSGTSVTVSFNEIGGSNTYNIYLSGSNNINDILGLINNGNLVASDVAGGQEVITELTENVQYWFNVEVINNFRRNVYTSSLIMTDVITPTISDPVITTSNVTANSITWNWTKATDNNDSSLLVYELWEGDEGALSDISTIKTQTKVAEGTDINTVTIDTYSSGESISVAVLVRDLGGNEAIYGVKNESTLNLEVDSITVEANGEDVSQGIQLNNGQLLQLDITVTTLDSGNDSYTTSIVNTSIASIDGSDIITGVAIGTTTLIITADIDGTEIEVPVEVVDDELANDSEIIGITTA